jgi:hypothetical protein
MCWYARICAGLPGLCALGGTVPSTCVQSWFRSMNAQVADRGVQDELYLSCESRDAANEQALASRV